MLAVGGGVFAYVDCHIEYFALYASYEFGLCERWLLKMQAAYYASSRATFVVLYEFCGYYFFVEFSL